MKHLFCERLRELRIEKGLRQLDLAQTLSLAHNTISSWERGNSEPSLDDLTKLAEFFSVTAGYLLGLEELR